MTGKQECKLAMQQALREFLTKNREVTVLLPNFSILDGAFGTNLEKIQQVSGNQVINRSGITAKKEQLRVDVALRACDVSHKLVAYATMTNNIILKKEVYYTETDIKKSTNSSLINKALLLHKRATANAQEVEDYGLTTDMLTKFKSAIDNYSLVIPSTRLGKTELKGATSQLSTIFKENDSIIEKFDMLVEVVHTSHPEFFESYKSIRKVINKGKGSLALMARVIDSVTGEPIKGAKLTLVPQNGLLTMAASTAHAPKPVVKKTAEKGIAKKKNMTDGRYIATVEKVGFATETKEVNIVSGEMTVLDIKLSRN